MSAQLIELKPGVLGDGAVVDVDRVLDGAKGELSHVVVIGRTNDGELDLRMSHGSRETLWLLRKAERLLLDDDDVHLRGG